MDKKWNPEEYNNFDMTLEECRRVFDAIENLVIVDADGNIKYLSPNMYFMIEAYNKRPVPKTVVGKHVNEVHHVSKITNALKSGKPIKNCFYFSSDVTNIARIEPLYDGDKLVGAIDYDIFTNGQDLNDFLEKLEEYSGKGLLNFKDTFHSMYDSSKKNAPIKYSITDFIGQSAVARQIRQQIANLSESSSTVLISGKTGCGKEVVAHSIHNTSRRCKNPLIAVNCAAIPESLVESEFFGYEEGSFTGAQKGGKSGLFELANHGTLFLDEVDQLPYHIQPKLLRVLQEKEVTRIGGTPTPVDVRVIAATNKDLWQMVLDDKFREDLYYRLNVMEIQIPPLAERKEDIPLLVDHQLQKINQEAATSVKHISKEVMELFLRYDWPGNVRELNNLLERSVILCQEDTLKPEHLGTFVSKVLDSQVELMLTEEAPLEQIRMRAEANAIQKALELTAGNRSKTAEMLKISRTSLYDKLRKYHLL